MFGSSDSYSYNDVIDLIIKDIEHRQLIYYSEGWLDEANALQQAINICEEHKTKGYC